MGTDPVTAQKIRKLVPIKIGDNFRASEAKHICSLCKKRINKNIKIKNAGCSIVWFGDNVAYLIVEVPKSHNASFRVLPYKTSTITVIPNELNTIFLKWEKRMSFLMSNGNFSMEKMDFGYRGSNDPILHELAVTLTYLVPKYNQAILDVLRYSPDVKERQKAAALLAWSNHDENLHYVLEWDLLSDPDKGVRNDVARSFSAFMNKIEDEKLLTSLIPAYCKQASFPNHTDRNKALYSILGILNNHPKLVNAVNPECKKNIDYISKTSILENIKNPAKDILSIIEAGDHA